MPVKSSPHNNLQRETLRKMSANSKLSDVKRQLAALRVAYSEDSKLLTACVDKLVGVDRLYLTHLPTQTSGRWSTWITNWPRACINPECQAQLEITLDSEIHGYIEHEWTDTCWSVRDILKADDDEVLITWDHDNIEGRIHDLIVNDTEALQAHAEGFDLHTITCCRIFGYTLPSDLRNPHTSGVDAAWRRQYNWQGKDTKQRVLAKNFNHGSKYTESYRFVHRIQGIERYGVSYRQLEQLAKRYIQAKQQAWNTKLDIMQRIRRERISRSLYGFRRVFFDSSAETGREGFSHMISATVSDYNNMTLQRLNNWLGSDGRLLHNAHDGNKYAIKRTFWEYDPYSNQDTLEATLRSIIERPIEYEGRSLVMTAGIKVYA